MPMSQNNVVEEVVYDIDNIINHIRGNSLQLINGNYSKQQLLTSGIMKGKNLLTGNVTKQNIVDLSAIGIALLLKK